MVITAWWFNKVLFYSIALPGVLIGLYEHGLNDDFLWLLFLFLCIHIILFSHKIELQANRLTYWRWPKFISKGIQIHQDDICGFERLPLSYARKIELAIYEVHLKDNTSARISLAAFPPKDIKCVLDWFGNAYKSSNNEEAN